MADEIQITRSSRWTRQRDTQTQSEGWVEVTCFCFTRADGTRYYQDMLLDDEAETFERQEAERKAKSAAILEEILAA